MPELAELRVLAWAGVESLAALAVSLPLALALGGPLGVLLYQLAHAAQSAPARALHGLCSLPCAIGLLALAHLLGPRLHNPALALALAAIPLFARLVASSLRVVPRGLIDSCLAMGASPLQIVVRAMLPQARAALGRAIVLLAASLLAAQLIARLAFGA